MGRFSVSSRPPPSVAFPGMSEKRLDKKLQSPLKYRLAPVAFSGEPTGTVAGLLPHHARSDLASHELHLSLEAGVSKPSSMFVMRVPGLPRTRGGDDRVRRLRGGHLA